VELFLKWSHKGGWNPLKQSHIEGWNLSQ
jgi:hypothetical protein